MPPLPAVALTCLLLGEAAHLPNALRNDKGEVRPLGAEEYERLKRKARKRGQVAGALFMPSLPGCNPLEWEHVVRAPSRVNHQVAREHYLHLKTAHGGTSTVYVRYPKQDDIGKKKWNKGRAATKQLYNAGMAEARAEDLMSGGMIGHGIHIARVGGACTRYACTSPSDVQSSCGILSSIYQLLFGGKDIEYEALPLLGGKSAPMHCSSNPDQAQIPTSHAARNRSSCTEPPTWAVSKDLGNPMHLDILDGHRGYAMWFLETPGATVRSWFFLLPEHGVRLFVGSNQPCVPVQLTSAFCLDRWRLSCRTVLPYRGTGGR